MRVPSTCPILRSHLSFAVAAVGLLVGPDALLMASPGRGANCISCHSQARNGMELTGFVDTLDLGGGDGSLKLYRVEAGQVVDIGIDVLDTGGDLAISGFSRGGENDSANGLNFEPGSGWTSRSSGSYFTRGVSSGSPQVSWAMGVDPSTPADIYRLEMQIAGDNGGRWGERERFYVEVLGGTPVTPPTVLLPAGSVWYYLDDGSDQGTAWREPAFDDSGWSSGPAELGYGDGDEQTEVSFGGNSDQKYITTYFRTRLQLPQAGAVNDLRIRVIYDDGMAAYLNGMEVARDNLASGAGFDTSADEARGSGEEDAWTLFNVPAGALQGGENVLAVEIHQSSVTSSDISFDLELSATMNPVLLVDGSGIEYPTQTGKTYQFERSADLGVWVPEGTAVTGDGQPIRLNVTPGGAGNAFYRVRIDE